MESGSYSSAAEEKEKEKEKMVELEVPLLLLNNNSNRKGGFRTLPFIIGNEAFERVANEGLMPNMILYLMDEYHLSMAAGTNILLFKNAVSNFTPLLGAFLADSLVGRFSAIGFGSIVCLLGMILLWLTAMFPQARPPQCDVYSTSCSSSTTLQLILLCSSFLLMSVGAGGIRGTSLAFGADQLNKRQGMRKDEEGVLESYFGWYYASKAFSGLVALTFIVYIQEQLGWKVGFGVPACLMFLSALSFFLASPFYVKLKAKTSLFTGLVQVMAASYKNRHLILSSEMSNTPQFHTRSALVFPSENLRFLNKACIIKGLQQELTPDGRASNPWSLCTVDQVEELKGFLKIFPLWMAGALMSINISQHTFLTLQTRTMDRHVISSFEIPVGSFVMFAVVAATLWIVLYDRMILPLASRIMGRPVHFTPLQRMGIGIFLASLSMAFAAVVESFRRSVAINEGYSDDPQAVVSMSAMWLIPQLSLIGFAEALFLVAQNEFYVAEFPKSMSSIALSIGGLGGSVASLLASLLLNTIDHVTRRDGNVSWVSSNINEGHYDYYYGVLGGLSFLNLMYFQVCSRAYGPVKKSR